MNLVAVLNRLANLGHVGQVKLRVDALGEPVEAQRDQVDVAGTLAVAQQAAFHAVGAGQHGQLGGGHAHAFVVVRVEGEHHGVTVVEVGGDVLHFVGEHVRRGHFHGGGQVDRSIGCSGVGLITPITALHTSTAYSGSVPVKDSGEYS